MPSFRLLRFACFRSYSSIRLPGELEWEEEWVLLLNRRVRRSRPRDAVVPPEETDSASLLSAGGDGSLSPSERRSEAD